MFLLSLLTCLLIVAAHLSLGGDSVRYYYISELRESNVGPLGYLIFIIIAGQMIKMIVMLHKSADFSFESLYYLSLGLLLYMMFTPSYAMLHGLAYFAMIVLVVGVYWMHLWVVDELLLFFFFSVLFLAIIFWIGPVYGGPVMQKALLLYFLLIINGHYYSAQSRLLQQPSRVFD